jgi:hypothetical protein
MSELPRALPTRKVLQSEVSLYLQADLRKALEVAARCQRDLTSIQDLFGELMEQDMDSPKKRRQEEDIPDSLDSVESSQSTDRGEATWAMVRAIAELDTVTAALERMDARLVSKIQDEREEDGVTGL